MNKSLSVHKFFRLSSIFIVSLVGISNLVRGDTTPQGSVQISSSVPIVQSAKINNRAKAIGASRSDDLLSSTTSQNESLDSVKVEWEGGVWSLRRIEDNWNRHEMDFAIRAMRKMKDPQIANFLYRVAIADPSLYRGRHPEEGVQECDHAIQVLIWMHTPAAQEALQKLLTAAINDLTPLEQQNVHSLAAQGLLAYKNADHSTPYKILDQFTESNPTEILCPFIKPGSRSNKLIVNTQDPQVVGLIDKWMMSSRLMTRLEAANCAAKIGVRDEAVFKIAQQQINKSIDSLAQTPRNEKFYASQILLSLYLHGHKEVNPYLKQLHDQGY